MSTVAWLSQARTTFLSKFFTVTFGTSDFWILLMVMHVHSSTRIQNTPKFDNNTGAFHVRFAFSTCKKDIFFCVGLLKDSGFF